MRSASGPRPLVFLSGLPGVTSHHTRSSLSRLSASSAGAEMGLVRRIEGSAEQADPHAGRMRREQALGACGKRGGHGRIWPLPRMRYLKVVSCSTPTGPRACSRPVAMPISAPKPNSPPSANWVEALCSTIAESTSREEFLGRRGVVGDDGVGVVRAVALDMGDRRVDAVDQLRPR